VQGKSNRPEWLTPPHLLESIADGVVAVDSKGSIVYASEKALRYLGREEKQVLGLLFSEVVCESIGSQEISELRNLEPGKDLRVDCAFPIQKEGGEWARVALSPVHHSGVFVGAIATLTDIADFKEAGAQHRASRAQFEAIFQNLPFECWVMERSGEFLLQNQESIERLGEVGSNTIDCVGLPDDTLRDYHIDFSLANQGEEARRDVTLTFPTGRKHFNRLLVPIRDANDILGILGVCVETTERRNLEEQLAQSQKLDAVGRLAGGIAHDFNNVLTAILSCVRLLERRLDGPPRRELQIIRDGAQRASELTRQLLAFSKQEMAEPRRTSIDELVIKSDRLLRRLIGEDIELVTIANAKGYDVVVDPVRIEQAIINLIVNARDALPKGGKITVRCSGLQLTSSQQAADGQIPPGAYALIEVQDTGVGMSEETKARAFEPFFTTRQVAGGTGLGLSSVYGSVHQAQGYVTLVSAPGEGTTVGLYLPRADPNEATIDDSETEPLLVAASGTETILLVEDEPMVMSVTCQSLRLSGYTVLEARGLEAALEVASKHDGTIDLLLTDVVMPHGTGPDLAASLRAKRPNIAVLFMSGYGADRIDVDIDAISFLAKPFTPDRLDAQVRKVLDAKGAKSA
jgi:PAS domain S-box-containing protein